MRCWLCTCAPDGFIPLVFLRLSSLSLLVDFTVFSPLLGTIGSNFFLVLPKILGGLASPLLPSTLVFFEMGDFSTETIGFTFAKGLGSAVLFALLPMSELSLAAFSLMVGVLQLAGRGALGGTGFLVPPGNGSN